MVTEAEGLIPLSSLIKDVGNGAEGFDVVDDGGFVFEAVGNRERRFIAGKGVFALERVEE